MVHISSMHNICAGFVQDCSYISNAQYMHKICSKLYFFLQCTIYANNFVQYFTYFYNVQYIRKIYARLYLFLICAIYVQDFHKIVLISQCAKYAHDLQDCIYFSNAQYMHKIYSRLIVLISSMHNICARFA